MARGLSSRQMYSRFYSRFSNLRHYGNGAGGTFTIKNERMQGTLHGISYCGRISWGRFSNGETVGSMHCEIDGREVTYTEFSLIIKSHYRDRLGITHKEAA